MGWKKEEQNRLRKWGRELEPDYRLTIENGTEVTIKWDGGGDECIMSVYFDGKEQDYEDNRDFMDYVACLLQIPSVGEFFMKGSGRVFIDNSVVKLEHKSQCTGLSCDHVDVDAPGFDAHAFDWEANMKTVDEERTGTIVLFE